jgi:hypothetical protein
MTLRSYNYFGSRLLRSKLIGNIAGIAIVFIAACAIIFTLRNSEKKEDASHQISEKYLNVPGIDFGNPVDRSLFLESLNIFYPDAEKRNDSLLQAIDNLRQRRFSDAALKSGYEGDGLQWNTVRKLSGMYLQFILIYTFVLIVIYFAAQRIAIYRFVKMKQHRESYLEQFVLSCRKFKSGTEWIQRSALSLLKALAKGILLVILFSPAYVIAYSVKTTLDTSSIFFMVLLGILSNGVLIQTANKFFTLLVAESRKGYVQTAIVKNLNNSYEWDVAAGIRRRSLWMYRENFQSHVFGHMYSNARFQFIPVLKEYASFLITGLIIIEMALNIQGHLCYELLQQILYRHFDTACLIIFGIFLLVKATEIVIDIWYDREKRKYGYWEEE